MQLFINGVKILRRVSALTAGYVNHVNEKSASVYMPQKRRTEPDSVGSTFYKSGDICKNKAFIFKSLDNAEIWNKRGKMIICNFGLGGGYNR